MNTPANHRPIVATGVLAGSHVHVSVRGDGIDGQRPCLGKLIMTPAEWDVFSKFVSHEPLPAAAPSTEGRPLISDATKIALITRVHATIPGSRARALSVEDRDHLTGCVLREDLARSLDFVKREAAEARGFDADKLAPLDALIETLEEANEEAARSADARELAFAKRTMGLGLGCTAPMCSRCGGCSARGSGACAAPCGPCAICDEQEAVEPACAACEVEGASGSDYGREHTCRDEDGPWTQLAKSMSLPAQLTTDSTNVGSAMSARELGDELMRFWAGREPENMPQVASYIDAMRERDAAHAKVLEERLHTATWSPGRGPPLTFAIGPVPSRIIHGRRHTMLPVDDCERLKVAIRAYTVDATDAAGEPAPNGPAEAASVALDKAILQAARILVHHDRTEVSDPLLDAAANCREAEAAQIASLREAAAAFFGEDFSQ